MDSAQVVRGEVVAVYLLYRVQLRLSEAWVRWCRIYGKVACPFNNNPGLASRPECPNVAPNGRLATEAKVVLRPLSWGAGVKVPLPIGHVKWNTQPVVLET